VKNQDLWQELLAVLDGRPKGEVAFEWVKGHSGHVLNEAADRLANAAALSWKNHTAPDPGPGFAGSQRVRL
jgi:ribonuclease HI